jgi:hypothetical protein
LAINSQLLDADPERLPSATIYNGSLDRLPEAYPQFRDMPGIFRNAAASYPSDPE